MKKTSDEDLDNLPPWERCLKDKDACFYAFLICVITVVVAVICGLLGL